MSCASNTKTALKLRAPCLFLQELEAEEYGRKGINLTPDLWLVKLMVRVAEVCRAGLYVACCVWGTQMLAANTNSAAHSHRSVLECCAAHRCCLRLCVAPCLMLLGHIGNPFPPPYLEEVPTACCERRTLQRHRCCEVVSLRSEGGLSHDQLGNRVCSACGGRGSFIKSCNRRMQEIHVCSAIASSCYCCFRWALSTLLMMSRTEYFCQTRCCGFSRCWLITGLVPT